jgi:isoleucyl-tRNA synthetase
MFKPVSNKVDFSRIEQEILQFWEETDAFKTSLRNRKDAPPFIFYDGPPFATGLPHYGHLLAGTIKDIVPRYWTMRGYRVERRFGWDCHGLPIEALAQEALGLSGAGAIVEKGVEVFNETCRSMVMKHVADWRRTVSRMGRWVDFDNDYKTMDLSFMETIWWVFKQLWDQGRIYKSFRVMPYSWKLATPLSNFEAGANYQEVQDPSVTLRLRLLSGPPAGASEPWYLLIWTTTPWTLPANLAVCAGPDIEYVAVRDLKEGGVYVLAAERLASVFPGEGAVERTATFRGADLAGWCYEPLFPYYADRPGAFRVLVDPFVSTEDGTGLVHLAPAFGEDDFRVGRAAGIEPADPLDANCAFVAPVTEYAGQFCKDADKAILRRLKQEGKLVHQSTIVHSYPFCERTDTPLVYRAIEAWYVRVEDLRDRLIESNQPVHWVPEYVGKKRFENWLRDARDWNISRNRFWGSCIPVWVAEDGSDSVCVGSIRELEDLSGQRVSDLHKHIVDRITFVRNGKIYRRTPEVLDCWFESGSMPFAQQHYPFEHGDELDQFFPAHFIAEGLDQTRGWFYTLLILSTALFGRSPFRNVVVNGLVLAKDGRKMSKRLKNYPDPILLINTYGADALRLYLIHSPVVRAEDLCFSEDGVKHSLRHLLIPLWNAYSFFATYARVDGWTPGVVAAAETAPPAGNPLDRWILSRLDALTQDVVAAMDKYELQQAVRPLVAFVEDLTNWYIRRSRRRFWKSDDDADKAAAYATLYETLLRFCRIAAPFIPFVTEAMYQNLRRPGDPESVHFCDFPVSGGEHRDRGLEEQMADVMTVVGLARQVRAQHDLKVRQPLAGLHVVCRDSARLDRVRAMAEVIADELNIKEVRFSSEEGALATLHAKANFRALGPKLGSAVKQAAAAIAALDSEALLRILNGGRVAAVVQGQPVEFGADDVLVERTPREGLAVASEGEWIVALETALTEALVDEGSAREFINKVQTMRKDADFVVTQRIRIRYASSPEVRRAIETHAGLICQETLCDQLEVREDTGGEERELNGIPLRLQIEPVG